MSIDLVGRDLLPNTYIKHIEISDLSEYSTGAEITVCVIDSKTQDNGFFWSDKELLLKNMKLLFVKTEDISMIGGLSNSTINFDITRIKTNPLYNSKTTDIQIKNVSSIKQYMKQNIKYYECKFKTSFLKNSSDVGIFCATSISTNNLAQQYGLDLFNVNINLFTGPVSSEMIIENSNLRRRTSLFIDPEGKQYIGPVHLHPSKGYMAGSRHTQTTHPKLKKRTIYNYKIKDYREYRYQYKDQSAAFTKLQSKTEFTRLYNSFNSSNQSVIGMFGVNVFNIILNKTLYGKSILKLDRALSSQLYSNLTFKNIIIERQKIKPIQGDETIIDQMNIIKTFSKRGSIPPQSNLKRLNMTLQNTSDNVRFYEFIDSTLNSSKFGFYKYKIKMSFNDPSVKIVNSMMNELDRALSQVKSYLVTMSSKNNFDRDMNSTTNNFISFVNFTYATDLTSAPYIEAPNTFLKYKKYIYNLTELQEKQLKNNMFSWLHPQYATIKSVRTFIREFEFLIHEMKSYFNFNVNLIKDMDQKSYLKNNTTSQMIELEHRFEQIVQPSAAKVHYNFLPNIAGGPLTKLTPGDMQSRLSIENEKFGVTITSESNDDLFISPIQIAEGLTKINLTNVELGNMRNVEKMVDIASRESEFSLDWDLNTSAAQTISAFDSRNYSNVVASQENVNTTLQPGMTIRMGALSTNNNTNRLAAVARSHTMPLSPITTPKINMFRKSIDAMTSNVVNVLTISEPVCEDNANNTTTAEAAAAASGMSLATLIETTRKTSATAYFSDESKFANFEIERESCFKIKKSDSFKKSIGHKVASSVVLPNRNDDKFNLTSKISYVGNIETNPIAQGTTNPVGPNNMSAMQNSYTNFSQNNTNIPMQIRRLFDPNVKISDIFNKKGPVLTEIEYFSLVKIEVLTAFGDNDMIDFNNAKWKILTGKHLQNVNRPLFCKMSYYDDDQLDISSESVTKLPFANKYFFITQTDVNSMQDGEPATMTPILQEEIDKFINSVNFKMEYSTTNIMKQNQNVNIPSLTSTPASVVPRQGFTPAVELISTQPMVPSSAPGGSVDPGGIYTGGSTGGSSTGMTGGGGSSGGSGGGY